MVPITILPLRIFADERRVILLPFVHGYKLQIQSIFQYVRDLQDGEVAVELERLLASFDSRHAEFRSRLLEHYALARKVAVLDVEGEARKLLLGGYFTMEYAFQAAALFNPSITPHPEQSGLAADEQRFVMSLRAVGEGHLSSVVFKTGVLDGEGLPRLEPDVRHPSPTRVAYDRQYARPVFRRKLAEMGVEFKTAESVLAGLADSFTLAQLEEVIAQVRRALEPGARAHAILEGMLWLARSNYQLRLVAGAQIQQLMLFPHSDSEARGIEDLRLVRFTDDDEKTSYLGTYTAYNGSRTLPMLVETQDFRTLNVHTLNGDCVQNKGMALFPRKIAGHYAMCSRNDGRNLFLMFSDHIHFWESARMLASPKYAWEYRLMGNCGSPIETPQGWLLLTHGVGPLRQYSIGAILLDRGDPFRVLGRLKEPLLFTSGEDREGYVPNVVYSCGAMLHRTNVVLPYAMSDRRTGVALIELEALLAQLKRDGA